MPNARIVPNAVSVTEWYSRIDGTIESCGQACVAMALHVLKGTPATAQFVTQLSEETVAAREVVDWPHASTAPDDLKWLLAQHKSTANIHWNDWEAALRAQAGYRPVIVGVSNATVFGGHDSHVHGHYVCVFGVNGGGNYIVGDPNTPESTSGAFVIYSPAQFDAAEVFAAIVPKESPLPGPINNLLNPLNQAMYGLNGFDGLVEAIATDERTSPMPQWIGGADPLYIGPNLAQWFAWFFTNFRTWLIRAVVIGVGLLLILGVLIQTMKQADPEFWQSLSAATPQGPEALMNGQALQSVQTAGGMGGGGGAGAGAAIPPELAAL